MKVYQKPESSTEKEQELQILALNGIPRRSIRRKTIKKYRFYLYKFNIIALFQNEYGGQPWLNKESRRKESWSQISTNKLSKDFLKAKKLAIRTLYILGYDLGMVEICVHTGAPKHTVSKIFYHQQTADVFESTLNQFITEEQIQEQTYANSPTVLGADVEAVLRHTNGKYLLASKFFGKRGRVGHDAIWIRGNRSSYPLVELRPAPSENPLTLYKNVYRCLRHGVKKVNSPSIQWLAGGRPLQHYPIGGHIHFSKHALDPHFIRALDNYLTLPLSVLESNESLLRRPRYGYLGDYREQFHGGFEYRTPPSWIVSPRIAKGVLCLAKLLTIEYKQLSWFPLLSYDTHEAFYEGNRTALYPIIQNLWQELQTTNSYTNYAKELDKFYELIQNRFIWDEFADIRSAWRLSPYS